MVDHLGKAGVLILHGMGRQKPSYAGTFMRDLRIYLDQRGWSYADVALEAVHFAGVFDEIQVRRAPKMIPTSAWWQIITRFGRWVLTYILSDAVSYKSGGGYARVQDKVSASLKELQARLQARRAGYHRRPFAGSHGDLGLHL